MPTPTKYTYSISSDFPNGKVATDRLTLEIQASAVTIALDYINTAGDDCDIWFKDALPGGDVTALSAVVAAHQGNPLSDDAAPVAVAYPVPSVADGYLTTVSTAFTAVRATVYTEQTSNAQRSVQSLDANDTLAGTGARKLLITYFDVNMSGPFYETVSMAGLTPVDTAASDICYIERMDVLEVGSQSSNVGNIYLKAAAGGVGAVIGSIIAGDGETNWCHHYVAASKTMKLVEIVGAARGLYGGALHVRKAKPTSSVTPESTVYPVIRLAPGVQTFNSLSVPVSVTGPARVTLYVRPDSTDSIDWTAGFGFYEEGL